MNLLKKKTKKRNNLVNPLQPRVAFLFPSGGIEKQHRALMGYRSAFRTLSNINGKITKKKNSQQLWSNVFCWDQQEYLQHFRKIMILHTRFHFLGYLYCNGCNWLMPLNNLSDLLLLIKHILKLTFLQPFSVSCQLEFV